MIGECPKRCMMSWGGITMSGPSLRIDYTFIGPQYKDTFVESKWFYFSTDSDTFQIGKAFLTYCCRKVAQKKYCFFWSPSTTLFCSSPARADQFRPSVRHHLLQPLHRQELLHHLLPPGRRLSPRTRPRARGWLGEGQEDALQDCRRTVISLF